MSIEDKSGKGSSGKGVTPDSKGEAGTSEVHLTLEELKMAIFGGYVEKLDPEKGKGEKGKNK